MGSTLLHYDGQTWTEIQPLGLTDVVLGVWSSDPQTVFANNGLTQTDSGILQSSDAGATWSLTRVPGIQFTDGVWGTGPTDVYAVGFEPAIPGLVLRGARP